MITYVIENEPIAWKRVAPRYSARSMYDTQKPIKMVLGAQIQEQHAGKPLYKGPLELTITFYMKLPQINLPKKEKLLSEKWHSIKPDSSNMLKLIEDICKSVLFHDDAQIAVHHIFKMYDTNPRTEFTIRELL